jgi:hypothetical protein
MRKNMDTGIAHQLRIARPTTDLERAAEMYCRGLQLAVLASFRDHDGFDGVIVGSRGADYHLEFTQSRRNRIVPTPTPEDLLVFYYSSKAQWLLACARMGASGFDQVIPSNPYWNGCGRCYQDPDGYLIVLQQEIWNSGARE